jgi:hypothetical protein
MRGSGTCFSLFVKILILIAGVASVFEGAAKFHYREPFSARTPESAFEIAYRLGF